MFALFSVYTIISMSKGSDMMKKLSYENYQELQQYIEYSNYNDYNANSMTLLLWIHKWPIWFKTYDNYALVYFELEHQKIWLMPFCNSIYLKAAFDEIISLSNLWNITCKIYGMNQEVKNFLMTHYPLQFYIEDDIDAHDYVYDRFMHQNLSGKKMQKRRNHYNAFMKDYQNEYRYRPLQQNDLLAMLNLLQLWKDQKETLESYEEEYDGINAFMTHYHQLPIFGGCIEINGQMQAFLIASYINQETVQIHIEKVNHIYRGLSVVLLKHFLDDLNDDVLYINREDDMGLEYLRKAKNALHPIYKIHKYQATLSPLTISHPSNKEEIKQLWIDSFDDESDQSTDYYFDHFYDAKQTYVLKHQDELLCMLQARDFKVIINYQEVMSKFIVGVATPLKYQMLGYMKVLMNEIKKKHDLLFLQAYNPNIYHSLGFQDTYYLHRYEIKPSALRHGCFHLCQDAFVLKKLYDSFTKNKNGYRIRDLHYYETLFKQYHQLWNHEVYTYEREGQIVAYIIKEDNRIIECIYESKEDLIYLLNDLNELKIVSIDLDEQVILDLPYQKIMNMMVYHTHDFPKNSLYINESL